MLTIRLQRTGKKNQADFRIVLAEKHKPVNKKYLEILGNYNPRKKTFKIEEERLKELLAQNIQFSPTINNLLISQNLLEGKKVQAFKLKKKKEEQKEAPTAPSAGADTPPSSSAEALEDRQAGGEDNRFAQAQALGTLPEDTKEEAEKPAEEAKAEVKPKEASKPEKEKVEVAAETPEEKKEETSA